MGETTLHNTLLQTTNECATMGQVDIMRQYLIERRRALRQELASIEKMLGIKPEKVTR